MGRGERRSKGRNWNNQKKNAAGANKESGEQKTRGQKRASNYQVSQKEIAENEQAIKRFKARNPVCELCNQPILEIASAMANRGSENPAHFDCIVKKLSDHEKLGDKDRMTYIGNGKFAVLHFENPHDMRHFSIVKEFEWEKNDSGHASWREEMANLYSQVK